MRHPFKRFLLAAAPLLLLWPGSGFCETVNLTYDSAGRLTSVDYTGAAYIGYTYDDAGNVIRLKVVGPDAYALDDDNDGLPNIYESGTCPDPADADSDDDGISDGLEDANHNGSVDPGETDPCSSDTDGDGIQDGTELGYTLDDGTSDTDTGVFQPDLDPLTVTDPFNGDSDGDGVCDGLEDANHNGRMDPGESDPNLRESSGSNPWLLLLLDG